MNEDQIFAAAVAETSLEARIALLKSECAGNSALRARLDVLLDAHDHPNPAFEQAPTDLANVVATVKINEGVGAEIGPYKLREQIGEGGFGVVFVAEQETPVRRKVALKIIKPGMDTTEIIARFEAERQALALMDHPNVARVLDAGATDSGRPYFVMELVRGVSITEFCDQKKLNTRKRAELFVDVCRAVQHAHQKGIIHRDIKPSNVMVTLHDGHPVPKVIDFGVAKAVSLRLTEKTVYTAYGQLIGTPTYMSPEQAEMSGLDVDTRADVYSLGVLLYELLTGSTPFDKDTLKRAGFDEMRRIIREDEPPAPSARIDTLEGAMLSTVSQRRGCEPGKLNRLLRGELDWVVMRSLEKDRNRRYESASAFAADVERYLHNEPVKACPPSVVYRFRKFLHRNAVALTTTTLVALALLIGTGVSVWQAAEANSARQAQVQQRQLAEANFQKALEAVDQMLTRVANEQLLMVPHMAFLRQRLLEDALRFYQEFLGANSDDPAIRTQTAVAHSKVAGIHAMLGEYKLAEEHYQRGLALLPEPFDDETEEFWRLEGLINNWSGLGAIQEKLQRLDEALESLLQAEQYHLQQQAYQLSKLQRPEGNARLAEIYHEQAIVHIYDHQLGKAEQSFHQTLELRETLVEEFPDVAEYQLDLLGSYDDLGAVLRMTGRLEQSEFYCREALQMVEELSDDEISDDPRFRLYSATSYGSLSSILVETNRTEDSLPFCRRAVEGLAALVADFPEVDLYSLNLAGYLSNLGATLYELGQYQESLQTFEQAWELRPDNPVVLDSLARFLANCDDPEFRDPERAVQLAMRAVRMDERDGFSRCTLGVAQYRAGDMVAAKDALERAITDLVDGQDAADDVMSHAGFFLAMTCRQLGDDEQAKSWFEKSEAWMQQSDPDDHELQRYRAEASEMLKQ
jgi:eukaryotic-like serine/threonine-protein kinase